MRTPAALAVLAVLALSLPAHAGLYLEHEAILPNPADLKTTIKQTLHTWQDGKKYKRDTPLRGETIVIDLEKNEVYGINAGQKTYWKMGGDKYQRLALFSLVVMGVSPTPDGKDITVPNPLFVETGQKATIDRWKAHEVKVQGNLPPGVSTSIWLSEEVNIPLAMLVDQMRLSLGDPKGKGYDSLFAQWKSLKGYPVQNVTTVNTPNGQVVTSETLLTYREVKIDPSEFAVPKGFALVEDPITQLEKQQAAALAGQTGPVGIGAPLGQKAPQPVVVPKKDAPKK